VICIYWVFDENAYETRKATEAKATLLSGLHPRLGRDSPVLHHMGSSPIFDSQVFHQIFQFANLTRSDDSTSNQDEDKSPSP